ncbi:MAG: tRNA (adenosine(37)-N6)-threonylcarbamoyltransferase complex dimerization subunit type 1 TsaB [Desulfobacca sp. 4484_104]|nr:MAG: tRNA (adenosine(37)-N6)-threonylcarbamoyltransferase complex dimerization subunit type 1 TsaB [Desulfobacca sp. 4484_104]
MLKDLVLAIDTASVRGSLALLQGERLLAEYTLESPASYLNRLLPGIDRLFLDIQRQPTEIKAVIVSSGPGNYTGLRIGMSTAKGLALGLDCPVVAIPTLETLAANFPFTPFPICPVLDAKKNEVYAAFYRCKQGFPEILGDYLLVTPAALADRITGPTILTGPGLERYGPWWQSRLGRHAVLAPPELRHLRASALGRLGLFRLEHEQPCFLDQLAPFYLRPAEAELHRRPIN